MPKMTITLTHTGAKEAIREWLEKKYPGKAFVVELDIEMESVGYGVNERDEPQIVVSATERA